MMCACSSLFVTKKVKNGVLVLYPGEWRERTCISSISTGVSGYLSLASSGPGLHKVRPGLHQPTFFLATFVSFFSFFWPSSGLFSARFGSFSARLAIPHSTEGDATTQSCITGSHGS